MRILRGAGNGRKVPAANEKRFHMNERKYIYAMKGLAIFCVVCAHATPLSSEAAGSSIFAAQLLDYLGTMGVPVLFMVSGYLFAKNTRSFGQFWRRKLVTIVVPWLFCETILWFYVVLRKGGISITAWLLFILGYQHTTYYLTVLMILYLVFWKINKDRQITMICAMSIFSIISTGWGIGINCLNAVAGTFYLNALNWAVFFGAGILLNRKDQWRRRLLALSKPIYIWLACSLVYFFACQKMEERIYYFGRWAVIQHVFNILLLTGIAMALSKKKMMGDMAGRLGEYSFSVYLLHQFAAGLIIAITNRFPWGGVMIRPFLIIAVVMLVIRCAEKVIKASNGRLDFGRMLIGIRG